MNICSKFWRPCAALRTAGRPSSNHQIYRSLVAWPEDKKYKALRIMFFGADNFSIESLRALRALQEEKPHKIAAIDVFCRPGKPVGRGLKGIREGL